MECTIASSYRTSFEAFSIRDVRRQRRCSRLTRAVRRAVRQARHCDRPGRGQAARGRVRGVRRQRAGSGGHLRGVDGGGGVCGGVEIVPSMLGSQLSRLTPARLRRGDLHRCRELPRRRPLRSPVRPSSALGHLPRRTRPHPEPWYPHRRRRRRTPVQSGRARRAPRWRSNRRPSVAVARSETGRWEPLLSPIQNPSLSPPCIRYVSHAQAVTRVLQSPEHSEIGPTAAKGRAGGRA